MDCVDVATNLSSYMLVLGGHQLLRHHSVGGNDILFGAKGKVASAGEPQKK